MLDSIKSSTLVEKKAVPSNRATRTVASSVKATVGVIRLPRLPSQTSSDDNFTSNQIHDDQSNLGAIRLG